MKNTNEKRETLSRYINLINDSQIELIYDIISLSKFPCKNDLMKLANYDNNGKVDTAVPIDYHRRIEETYPSINDANLIFDYNENTYGKMVNINDYVVKRILNTIK